MTDKTTDAFSIAQQIQTRINKITPQIAIILGSGLGSLAKQIGAAQVIPYSEIKGFPQTTVSGHKGCLILGKLNGKDVLCLQGRFHLYEGHQPQVIATVIKSLKLLGIKTLIVTNAAGSLRSEIAPGNLMLINDHINLSGQNPLIGPNDDNFGPRFPAMNKAYSPDLIATAHQVAKQENIPLYDGTYLMVLGPNFETAAEIRAFQILGADAVGMSTVPEVISAAYCGMKVLGISAITNYGAGMQNNTPSHEETLEQADKCAANMCRLVSSIIKEI